MKSVRLLTGNLLMQSVVILLPVLLSLQPAPRALASSNMGEKDLSAVKKSEIRSEEEKERLQEVAVLLAEYELEAIRMTKTLNDSDREQIDRHASRLMEISETVIDWARLRLLQCDEYLRVMLNLKAIIAEIEHEVLEKDYHLDGALPKAPPECYHIKDMYVHPASVLVLTRDDPALQDTTLASINAEISEVLGHTEVVRQLIIY